MEGTGQNKIVVSAELVQAGLIECPVEHEAAGLVDNDEREDGPGER